MPRGNMGLVMTMASSKQGTSETSLFEHCAEAVTAAERLLHLAKAGVRGTVDGSRGGLDAAQAAAHGLAWLATYVEALRQMLGWARRLEAEQAPGESEQLMLTAAFGEYLAQIAGGIPMSQGETVRLGALGVSARDAPVRGRGGRPDRRGHRRRDQEHGWPR